MQHIDSFLSLYDRLVDKGHTREEMFEWNDEDNRVFYIPHNEYKIICTEDQNCNFLIMFKHNPVSEVAEQIKLERNPNYKPKPWLGWEIHVRRYWKKANINDEFADVLSDPVTILSRLEYYQQYYSDAYEGVHYVDRPDLDWYIDRDFKWYWDFPYKEREKGIGYGDARDKGYLFSIGFLNQNAEGVHCHIIELEVLLIDLECLVIELDEIDGFDPDGEE